MGAVTRVLFILLMLCSPSRSQSNAAGCTAPVGAVDIAAIKAVIEAYRTSWLLGDVVGVQRTFTDESVLLPARGSEPVVGMEAIREFWWPKDAPDTKVLQLEITVEQVGGDGCFAFARGRDDVAWSSLQKGKLTRTRHKGTFLNAMKKMPDGSWRIFQHMWDDQTDEHF
jgi:ketosteroid isomerase-like protein